MSLENHYESLVKSYDQLRKANENYLINNSGIDGFTELIDLRSAILDDLEILHEDLISELASLKANIDYDSLSLIELIRELPKLYPQLLPYKNKVIEALENLIKSENNVSEIAKEERNELKKQLGHARTGQQTLNAYKPLTGYNGSHFIDSKK